MRTQAVARLKETSNVNKKARLWTDSFAAILKAKGVNTGRVRAMFSATKYLSDFGVEYEGNLGLLVKSILVDMYGTDVRLIKMRGDEPNTLNYLFRILNQEPGIPDLVSVNMDTSKIFLDFDRG